VIFMDKTLPSTNRTLVLSLNLRSDDDDAAVSAM
jgi:hypothetical protein